MDKPEFQRRIDVVRQFVATATGGICIGAALMIVAPPDVTRFVGIEHPDQMIAVKTAILAAAISLAARGIRITIRRK